MSINRSMKDGLTKDEQWSVWYHPGVNEIFNVMVDNELMYGTIERRNGIDHIVDERYFLLSLYLCPNAESTSDGVFKIGDL